MGLEQGFARRFALDRRKAEPMQRDFFRRVEVLGRPAPVETLFGWERVE